MNIEVHGIELGEPTEYPLQTVTSEFYTSGDIEVGGSVTATLNTAVETRFLTTTNPFADSPPEEDYLIFDGVENVTLVDMLDEDGEDVFLSNEQFEELRQAVIKEIESLI